MPPIASTAISAALIAATATAVVGIVSALIAYLPTFQAQREAHLESARALRRTRDPLLRASYDLQSRIYNLIVRNFLEEYLARGTPQERRYALKSTLWIFAQYFGWVEILRRESQYIDLGSPTMNRKLQLVLAEVTTALATDSRDHGDAFMTFRADQRAVGELMVTARVTGEGAVYADCLGYTEFLAKLTTAGSSLPEHPVHSPVLEWVQRIEGDLRNLSTTGYGRNRLIEVQRRLIHLVNLLDNDRSTYPQLNRRGRIPLQSGAGNPVPHKNASSPRARRVARFQTEHDPSPIVELWAERVAVCKKSDDGSAVYFGWPGPTLRRLRVQVTHDGTQAYVEASLQRGKHHRALNGSLRFTRHRRQVNDLLKSLDRPVITVSTAPARCVQRVMELGRRVWIGHRLFR